MKEIPHKLSSNTKGFTLMELMLVVILLGFLGTMAISSYFNSARNFQYLQSYKTIISMVRELRSISLTNQTVLVPGGGGEKEVPESFGLFIDSDEKEIILFADNGFTNLGPGNDEYHFGEYNEDDAGNNQADTIIREYNFSETDYELSVKNAEDQNIGTEVLILYPTSSFGDVRVSAEAEPVEEEAEAEDEAAIPELEIALPPPDDNDSVATILEFSDPGEGNTKNIVIIHFSGNIEETDNYQ